MSEDFIVGEIPASGTEPVSKGIYTAEFLGVESVPAQPDKDYKAGLKFKFIIMEGVDKGKIATNIGSISPTQNNISGKLMLGMGVRAGDNLKNYAGRKYRIVVEPNRNGRNVVQSVHAL